MTPRKAAAVARELETRCDEAFMFVCKVGMGCHFGCRYTSNPKLLLTMFLGLLDSVFQRLEGKPEELAIFKKAFAAVLAEYLEAETDVDSGTD